MRTFSNGAVPQPWALVCGVISRGLRVWSRAIATLTSGGALIVTANNSVQVSLFCDAAFYLIIAQTYADGGLPTSRRSADSERSLCLTVG